MVEVRQGTLGDGRCGGPAGNTAHMIMLDGRGEDEEEDDEEEEEGRQATNMKLKCSFLY